MANDLWDLSATVERMAVAMWQHEASRCHRFTTANNRTAMQFQDESDELRGKWIGLAGAALEAVFEPGAFNPVPADQ